jgi:hypothetical protein
MTFTAPVAVSTHTQVSKGTFGDIVIQDLNDHETRMEAVESIVGGIGIPAKIIGGRVYTTSGTLASGITTTETLTGIRTGIFTLAANAMFEVRAKIAYQVITTPALPDFRIRTSNLAGAIMFETPPQPGAVVATTLPYTAEISCFVFTSSSVSVEFVATCQRLGTGGTFSIFGGGGTQQSSMVITQINPSGLTPVSPI